MTAMFLAFATVGSLDYSIVLEQAPAIAPVTATAIALLLFLGAVRQVGPAARSSSGCPTPWPAPPPSRR